MESVSLKKKKFQVAIIGLGYVGLPLYVLCNKKKIDVIGFDNNKKKIQNLNKNISDNLDVNNSDLKRIKYKKIFNIKQSKNIENSNIIIFCLPTPLKKGNKPDLSFIKSAFNCIKKNITPNTILVLESTVYPGATREIFEKYVYKNFKLKDNIDFAYSSERISPGQTDKKKYNIKYEDITKVISANRDISLKKIEKFYQILFRNIYKAKSIEIAEMSKLLENSYRAVNISLVNELKIICHENNIEINDVISAASTKPFGFTSFKPGPGVGGHCIPIDPLFISWFTRKQKNKSDLVDLARKKNLFVTNWIIKKIQKICLKKKIKKKILLIGMAYKENVNDYRESPALKIFVELNKKFSVDYYDPFINQIKHQNKLYKSINNLKKLKNYELTILTTAHSVLSYQKIFNQSKIIVDTRGVFKHKLSPKIINL